MARAANWKTSAWAGRAAALVLAGAAFGLPSVPESATAAPPDSAKTPSKFRSSEDGAFDMSGFLDEKYGFLPLVIPITEPAVGYGAAGAIAFLSSSLSAAKSSYERPNITIVGGLGTENGTWGTLAGDMRHWLDNRLQTLCGVVYASVNLDFYGVGEDAALADHPLRYNLEPKGGALQGKYRLGDSRFFAGASYAFVSTQVSFDSPPGTSGLPEYSEDSDVGGITPSLTFDTRDNMFTPIRGAYVEATMGVYSSVLGGDDEFQRARIIGMQFFALPRRPIFFGYRGELAASFGDAPFYLQPFVSLRGAPALRYQGEEVAQIEVELRWQFWKRYSLVGFTGYGAAWNDFDLVNDSQSVVTGGAGARYEIARSYGIHMGLDVAFGPETTAIYVQAGSAWARP